MARMNKPYEAVWATMMGKAKEADVRPTPLSKTRTAPGNVRFGSLQEQYDKEVAARPATPQGMNAAQFTAQSRLAPPQQGPELPASGWMGKGDGTGKSGIRVFANDAATRDRLMRSGYSMLDQATPSEGENRLFGRGFRADSFGAYEAPPRAAPGVYDAQGSRMESPRMVSATGPDLNGRQSTWYATARDTEDVIVPGRTREDEGPTPIEVQRELSVKQYEGYRAAQARLAQEDAARIAGESDAQSIWDRFDQGMGNIIDKKQRELDARNTLAAPMTTSRRAERRTEYKSHRDKSVWEIMAQNSPDGRG
jgi:hypothetical protein